MQLKLDFKRKLAMRLSRLVSTQTATACAGSADKAQPQDLYESIAVGNALAEIENDANRRWRG